VGLSGAEGDGFGGVFYELRKFKEKWVKFI
jgi:hypothetical protein